ASPAATDGSSVGRTHRDSRLGCPYDRARHVVCIFFCNSARARRKTTMSGRALDTGSILSQPEKELSRLLDEARGLSQRSLERVRLLKELFPDELTGTALDDLEQLEAEARRDRRHTPRFADNPAQVLISPSCSPAEGVIARV